MFVFKPGQPSTSLAERVPINELFETQPTHEELCKKVKTLENMVYRDLNIKRNRSEGISYTCKKSRQ